MGKTPKKAAPGGDERNLYVRRLKAMTAPSNTSETKLPERQRESDNSNRPKLTGVQKKVPSGSGKHFKSKLRKPTKLGLGHSSKPPLIATTSKGKKSLLRTPDPPFQFAKFKMQPESEETEVKLDVTIEEEVKDNNVVVQSDNKDEIDTDKEEIERVSENDIVSPKPSDLKVFEEETVPMENQNISQDKVNDEKKSTIEENRELEEYEQCDIKLCLEEENSSLKSQDESSQEKILRKENSRKENAQKENSQEESLQAENSQKENLQGKSLDSQDETKRTELDSVQEETKKKNVNEKENLQTECQTDTESCSVDIVESTTSELSETSESTTHRAVQKEKGNSERNVNDVAFVSYDSSIMLKDVQIKLNDCLKDNSKLFDASTAEHSTPNPPSRDISFGKALRSISGRHSINRMRHVTLREHRFSPNNSLFVNISSSSLPQDESTDFKILHYNTDLSETYPTNGTSTERKRKLETHEWNTSKKQKTENDNSLLNTSISLLKGLRRPIQISTPYKFHLDKVNPDGTTNDGNNKLLSEHSGGTRKWCSIM